ncbi:3-deoxy-7-phosphoheptulonate synthase, partial [Aliarcobacter butzleri]|uniref:3-deoxy-7-phosphoheptulonate synthase n=1 Tax=Aliarcobacter butzleri TaxID=28197 RepID=UPI003AF52419
MNTWTPSSWRNFPINQQPTYNDVETLAQVEKELASYSPLIFAGEALNLKKQLAKVVNK